MDQVHLLKRVSRGINGIGRTLRNTLPPAGYVKWRLTNLRAKQSDCNSLNPSEVQLRPSPVWSRALAWTIIGTASFGFILSVFAKIDEVVLASGELQPLGAERPVKETPFRWCGKRDRGKRRSEGKDGRYAG